jgi:hypothetical protein
LHLAATWQSGGAADIPIMGLLEDEAILGLLGPDSRLFQL